MLIKRHQCRLCIVHLFLKNEITVCATYLNRHYDVYLDKENYIYWSKVLTERFSIPYKNQTKKDKIL